MNRRRLTSVTVAAPGLKGWTGHETLSGCDLFAGPNGSGKTTRLLAILAGLRGLAETSGSPVGEYLGPDRPSCTVTLGWDDGASVVRDLGAVRGKKRIQADAQADAIAGRHLVRWDLSDFVAASDTARAALLRGLIGSGSQWDQARARARLTVLVEEAKADPAIVGEMMGSVFAPLFGAFLEGAIEWARMAYTEANAQKTTAGKAVEELQAQAAEREASAGRLADVRRREQEADRQLTEASASLAGAEERGQSAVRHREDGERLARAVGAAEDEAKAAQGALEAAERRLQGVPAPDLASLSALEEDAARAAEAKSSAAEALTAAQEAVRGAENRIATLQGRLSTLERLRGDAGTSTCRHCGGPDPLGLESEHARVVSDLAAAEDDLPIATLDLRSARVRSDRASEEQARTQRALLEVKARQERAGVERRAAEDALGEARGRLERARKVLDAAEVDLVAWRERGAPANDLGDLDTLRGRKAALEAERADLRRQAEALARLEGGEAAMQQAIARREAAEGRLAAVKALGTGLRSVQAEAAAEAYGPILQAAGRLLEDAGVPLVPYLTSEAEWGAEVHGRRVHFAALSDGERALVGAAFAYAFAACSGAPWRCLVLDRMEAIDDARVGTFLAAVRRAQESGDLDNFVGALRADRPFPSVAVAVHWLGAAATPRSASTPTGDPLPLF